MLRLIAIFLAVTFGAMVLNPGRMTHGEPAAKAATTTAKPSRAAGFAEETVLHRDDGGQFHVVAQIDGTDTEFLVDTGADTVALSVPEAERLGIVVDRTQFQPIGRSASGVAYGTVVRLDRFEVAGKELRGVEAVVLDGLSTNLLGQSVLREVGKVELDGDRMTIGG
jgi:aspartyl protease family protein